MTEKEEIKHKYVAPTLEVLLIKLEQGIAVGSASANVTPTDASNNVQDSWGADTDDNRTINW
ncbi:hypothetical protein [Mucilaginibacter lappiensis]|uniref:Putative ferredoxin-like protein n=1 Tax=Mucilaginibacter lappiensis TaxID=354630 RepID=A0A841JKE1_9SPHI|nr:hypothetical protein [Mucilaginibacter lappiensis]MBB6131653.1 putative ferredoxin-like protein [Mucilaginibacter lappiensis]